MNKVGRFLFLGFAVMVAIIIISLVSQSPSRQLLQHSPSASAKVAP